MIPKSGNRFPAFAKPASAGGGREGKILRKEKKAGRDLRKNPQRPYLAVSAAIVRDGKVLLVRRARNPARNLYTLPGGAVEIGETLAEAAAREVREETALEIDVIGFAGHREVIVRDKAGRVERHFVIMCHAARWRAGEGVRHAPPP